MTSVAFAAVDIALRDLAGKRTKTPLYILLGGAKEKVLAYNAHVGWLLVEFGGETKKECDEKARALMDEGNFNRVVLRCVGVGECRRHEKGTMCPSYRVTREEQHSTRGRARLLRER
jgi:L-alanine-DL-glutamate epimerase-like enolase superfamily enzyme